MKLIRRVCETSTRHRKYGGKTVHQPLWENKKLIMQVPVSGHEATQQFLFSLRNKVLGWETFLELRSMLGI